MSKTISAIFIPLVIATGITLQAQTVHKIWQPPFKEGIAAQVESRVITFGEIRRELFSLIPQVQRESRTKEEFDEKMSELYREILQNLIDRVVILKEYEEQEKFKLPGTAVEDEFDNILAENFNGDRSALHEHLRNEGKTLADFKRDLFERIIVSVMRGQLQQSAAEVSPERIESFYNENKMYFYEEESVHLRLILLRPIADEPRQLILQNARSIIEELDNGANFAELARRHSQDSRSESGGDWGWVNRTDLRTELSVAAFNLDQGEYSEPVVIGDQVYILFVEGRKDEGIQPMEDVRERIEEILANQISRQAQKAWIERLRKDAFVKYF